VPVPLLRWIDLGQRRQISGGFVKPAEPTQEVGPCRQEVTVTRALLQPDRILLQCQVRLFLVQVSGSEVDGSVGQAGVQRLFVSDTDQFRQDRIPSAAQR